MSGPILRLSALQSPVFLLNSRLDLFTATSLSGRCPFSRSYGAILPSSLAMRSPSTLGYSPQPPVSVCGTDTFRRLRDFSWGLLCLVFPSAVKLQGTVTMGFNVHSYVRTNSAAPSSRMRLRWYRNFRLFPITCPLRVLLRDRLTPGRLT